MTMCYLNTYRQLFCRLTITASIVIETDHHDDCGNNQVINSFLELSPFAYLLGTSYLLVNMNTPYENSIDDVSNLDVYQRAGQYYLFNLNIHKIERRSVIRAFEEF